MMRTLIMERVVSIRGWRKCLSGLGHWSRSVCCHCLFNIPLSIKSLIIITMVTCQAVRSPQSPTHWSFYLLQIHVDVIPNLRISLYHSKHQKFASISKRLKVTHCHGTSCSINDLIEFHPFNVLCIFTAHYNFKIWNFRIHISFKNY